MSRSQNDMYEKLRHGIMVGAAIMLASTTIADAQQSTVTVFPKAQIDQILKSPPSFYDRTLRILDMGTYQLAVAVAMHEPTSQTMAPAGQKRPRDPKAV